VCAGQVPHGSLLLTPPRLGNSSRLSAPPPPRGPLPQAAAMDVLTHPLRLPRPLRAPAQTLHRQGAGAAAPTPCPLRPSRPSGGGQSESEG